MTATARGGERPDPRVALRRAVVFPIDLFSDLERIARHERWDSVQAFVVVVLQAYADRRLARHGGDSVTVREERHDGR